VVVIEELPPLFMGNYQLIGHLLLIDLFGYNYYIVETSRNKVLLA